MKKCTVCNEAKELTDFNMRSDRLFKYRSECKKCQYLRQAKNKTPRPSYKDRCYSNFYNALRRGDITKGEKCEDCGSKINIEAHHEDYQDQLNVVWLCRKCHHTLHHKRRCG